MAREIRAMLVNVMTISSSIGRRPFPNAQCSVLALTVLALTVHCMNTATASETQIISPVPKPSYLDFQAETGRESLGMRQTFNQESDMTWKWTCINVLHYLAYIKLVDFSLAPDPQGEGAFCPS